jgi:hypothetical protein
METIGTHTESISTGPELIPVTMSRTQYLLLRSTPRPIEPDVIKVHLA